MVFFYAGLVEEMSSEEKGPSQASPHGRLEANVHNALLSFRDPYATGY